MRRVFAEVGDQARRRDDDGILLQLPAGRFLVAGEELQTRGVDGREVDLALRRRGRGGRDFLRLVAAARAEERRDYERESDSRKLMVTRTPAPVAPFASRGVSDSAYAVPAMSR